MNNAPSSCMRTAAATTSNRNTAATDQAICFRVFICDRCLVRRDDRAIVPRGHLIAYPSRWSDILPRNPSRHGPMIPISFEFYPRSEEHTSELQSLMRSSYAVLCLKKKK